jgi:hypothetical protein
MHKAPSPLKTVLYLWIGLILILLSGLIVYEDVPLYSLELLYVIVCIAVFSAGYCIAKKSRLGFKKKQEVIRIITWPEELHRYRNIISALAVCGILAAVLFAVEMYNAGILDTSNFGAVRDLFMQKKTSIYGQLAAILGAGGFFALVSAVICWDFLPGHLKFLWILSPALLSLFSVLSGGRQTVLQLILFAFFSFKLKKNISTIPTKKSFFAKTVFMSLVMVIIAYGMLAGSQRNSPQSGTSKKQLVMKLFDVRFNPEIDNAINSLPGFLSDGAAESIIYFTHTIPNLLYFLSMDNKPGPYLGLYEAPFIVRRLNEAGILDTSIDSIYDSVVDHYAATGRFALNWQTAIRDYIVDFTMYGTVSFLFIAGCVISIFVRNYEQNGGLVFAFFVVGFNLICFYSILFSAISDTFILFYFLICSALLLVKKLKRSGNYIVY